VSDQTFTTRAIVLLSLDKPRSIPQIARLAKIDPPTIASMLRQYPRYFRRYGRAPVGGAIVYELTDLGDIARLRVESVVKQWANRIKKHGA